MPAAPPRACRCGAVVPAGLRCGRCSASRQQAADENRGTATGRFYGAQWRRARAAWLSDRPLCAECERQGRVTVARCVDHIQPHKGNQQLFWDAGNWQSLCFTCHSIKTAKEDGGFGNRG